MSAAWLLHLSSLSRRPKWKCNITTGSFFSSTGRFRTHSPHPGLAPFPFYPSTNLCLRAGPALEGNSIKGSWFNGSDFKAALDESCPANEIEVAVLRLHLRVVLVICTYTFKSLSESNSLPVGPAWISSGGAGGVSKVAPPQGPCPHWMSKTKSLHSATSPVDLAIAEGSIGWNRNSWEQEAPSPCWCRLCRVEWGLYLICL